eukprot:6212973-Pleurochrysis_carterae.AAC.1
MIEFQRQRTCVRGGGRTSVRCHGPGACACALYVAGTLGLKSREFGLAIYWSPENALKYRARQTQSLKSIIGIIA